MHAHGFIIAAPRSGEGKTTIACGIMAALIKRGLTVQPFKIGPDYMDPLQHKTICGRTSVNLDSWLVAKSLVQYLYAKNSARAQISVVEGVMGLFDGSGDPSGSTGEIAQLLGLNVILVVDVSRMAGSAGALVAGFANYRQGVKIAGVIANRVGSERHYQLVKTAIEEATGISVIGGLGREVPTPDEIEKHLDLDLLLSLTKTTMPAELANLTDLLPIEPVAGGPVIAVAKDDAFSCYYQANRDLLEAYGGEIREFSPLTASTLPANTAGIYLSGHSTGENLKRLSANKALQHELWAAYHQGMPILAEGGGFDYLSRGYQQADEFYPLVGIVPTTIKVQERLTAMGYRHVTLRQDTVLGPAKSKLKGHEYHRVRQLQEFHDEPLEVCSANGKFYNNGGFASFNLLASQIHWHFLSNHQVVANFLTKAKEFSNGAIN